MGYRLRMYLAEIAFAYRICTTWGGFIRLVYETLLFHARNLLRRPTVDSRPFSVSIRLNHLTTRVWLRRSAGDLFVFYEVLQLRAYRLPQETQNPAEVRFIMDCGANVGLTSLYLADRYPNATIISVEPEPSNFELLKRNAEAIGRIVPVWGCIAETPGHRYFSMNRPSWGNMILPEPTPDGLKVPAYTIDGLMEEHRIAALDLLKVDIEGGEQAVFKRAGFLDKTRFLVIELHPPYSLEEFHGDLRPHGWVTRLPDAEMHLLTARPDATRGVSVT